MTLGFFLRKFGRLVPILLKVLYFSWWNCSGWLVVICRMNVYHAPKKRYAQNHAHRVLTRLPPDVAIPSPDVDVTVLEYIGS